MSLARLPLWIGALTLFAIQRAIGAPLAVVSASPDVDVVLGSNAQLVGDHDVAQDVSGAVSLAPLGTLPAASDISGYHRLANGDELLCFDTAVELPGPLTVQPGDIVRHSSSYTIEMAAAANGIPPGVYCDAVTVEPGTGQLMVSFDVSATLPGVALADDEDLVRRNKAADWSVVFDGSAAGVPAELDVDGADVFPANGHMALSFDGSGKIGGVDFDDEDILEYDPAGPTWTLVYDGSAKDPDWAAADLDALPEPAFALLFGAGIAVLYAIDRMGHRDPSSKCRGARRR